MSQFTWTILHKSFKWILDLIHSLTSLVAQMVKRLPTLQET